MVLMLTPVVNFANILREAFAQLFFFNRKFLKMTPAVNFINNLRTNLSYETSFRQLFSRYMYVKKTTFVRKIRTFMSVKMKPEEMGVNVRAFGPSSLHPHSSFKAKQALKPTYVRVSKITFWISWRLTL